MKCKGAEKPWTKKKRPGKYANRGNIDSYDKLLLEKINRNFLSDDFFKTLLEVKRAGEASDLSDLSESDNQTLFERYLEFAKECYIHGVTVGMKVAAELYEEDNCWHKGKY